MLSPVRRNPGKPATLVTDYLHLTQYSGYTIAWWIGYGPNGKNLPATLHRIQEPTTPDSSSMPMETQWRLPAGRRWISLALATPTMFLKLHRPVSRARDRAQSN